MNWTSPLAMLQCVILTRTSWRPIVRSYENGSALPPFSLIACALICMITRLPFLGWESIPRSPAPRGDDPGIGVEPHSVFPGVRRERLDQLRAGALGRGTIQPLQHVVHIRETTDPFQRGRDIRTVVDRLVHGGELRLGEASGLEDPLGGGRIGERERIRRPRRGNPHVRTGREGSLD